MTTVGEVVASGHVLVACDKFKGSLTAVEVAERIVEGVRLAAPDVAVRSVLVADGGDGTLDALVAAGFARTPVVVSGPTWARVTTSYVTLGGTAVVELADACGLVRLPDGRPAPLMSSSHGVGEVLRAVLDAGYRNIVLAVGGSASSDGGAGLLTALGAVLTGRDGRELPLGGGALEDLVRLDLSGLHPGVREARIVVASDVDNPLLGPAGAVAVYGAQKGAAGEVAARLERGLARWARVLATATGTDLAGSPGAGAAGGVGFGALAGLGAHLRPGIDLLLELTGFREHLPGAGLVLTGEGSMDRQTLQGKTPVGVARAAREWAVPVVALCGRSTLPVEEVRSAGIGQIYSLDTLEPDLGRCMDQAGPLLTRLARDVVAEWATHRR